MFWLIALGVGALLALVPGLVSRSGRISPHLVRGAGVVLIVFGLASTSYVIIDADSVGHLKRVFAGSPMPPGRIIALSGENGPQAEVLSPGLHVRPLLNVIYEVEELPVIEVPPGQYGLLTAKGGIPLEQGQFLARGWPDETVEDMLNAEHFLTHDGQKGPQLTVLKPGKYRLNQYLFSVTLKHALDVRAGEVAVIKSNVQEREACTPAAAPGQGDESGVLTVPLVPEGCIGVWDKPLLPNRYYLNELAYTPTIVPTRVQTWTYKGGYTRRAIDLTLSQEGKIQQREARPVDVPVPEDAADGAVLLTVEGWRVPLELRALVQVEPRNAPRVVASVGSLQEVENKIITPAIRSVIRNETGRAGDATQELGARKVMDLITKRAELEQIVEQAIVPEGLKAGVTIKEVRFGDPIVPPELLLARQRKQLAEQLRKTYAEEKLAQEQRIRTEKARATADQQDELVRAEIAVQVAEQTKLRLQKEGEGEKLRLTEIAAGQQAQTDVLGQDRVMQLAMLKEILAAAQANPDLVKVPTVFVQGESAGSLNGPAAVLGASNIMQWMRQREEPAAPAASAPRQ